MKTCRSCVYVRLSVAPVIQRLIRPWIAIHGDDWIITYVQTPRRVTLPFWVRSLLTLRVSYRYISIRTQMRLYALVTHKGLYSLLF